MKYARLLGNLSEKAHLLKLQLLGQELPLLSSGLLDSVQLNPLCIVG